MLKERGSDRLQEYFSGGSYFITSFCLFRGAGCPQTRNAEEGDRACDHYFKSCFLLLSYVQQKSLRIDEPEISSYETFGRAKEFAEKHSLDFSDALQLVGLKHGRFAQFVQRKPVLITADRALEEAAQNEGLLVWNCEREERPPEQ